MHTPGPWQVIPWPSDGINAIAIATDKTVAGQIAMMSLPPSQATREANARLIAAAPELLEALQKIANHQSRSDRRQRGMVDASELIDLQRVAETAINKATGTTPYKVSPL